MVPSLSPLAGEASSTRVVWKRQSIIVVSNTHRKKQVPTVSQVLNVVTIIVSPVTQKPFLWEISDIK